MKNILPLAFFFLFFASSINAQCNYILTMQDSWGDGWNGSFITVDINGNSTDYVFDFGDGDPAGDEWVVPISVLPGDVLTITYSEGGTPYPTEQYWEIQDASGNSLFSDGSVACVGCGGDDGANPPTNGNSWSGTVVCPACINADNLVINSLTTTDAEIGFSDNNTPLGTYTLEYGSSGFTLGTGTMVSGTNPISISGLTPSTDYDAYVQIDCGADGTSGWSGPISFFTSYCTPAPTNQDGDGITNVTMGTINNPTGPEPGFYGDYSSLVTDAPQGEPFNISVELSTGFTYFVWAWVDWNNNLDFTDPGEEYYLGESTNDNPTTLMGSINVPISAPLGQHRIRIGGSDGGLGNTSPSDPCYTGAWASFEDYTLNVIPPPACSSVSNVMATNISATSADISWTANGSETTWDIEVVPAGSSPTGIPTYDDVTNNPFSITGLSAITGYTIYVRADCGMDNTTDISLWQSVSITTPCAVFTPLYIEDFTDMDFAIPPNCWEEADDGDPTTGPINLGASAWTSDDFANVPGDNSAKMNIWALGKNDWLISPLIDLSSGGPYQVEFDFALTDFANTAASNLGSDDEVHFLISTDFGATWAPLQIWTSADNISNTGEVIIHSLAPYTGNTVQFAFWGTEGTFDDPEDNDIFVDDFIVRIPPSCPDLSSLALVGTTATDATVTWNDPGPGGSWDIEVVPTGTPPTGTPTFDNVNSNPYTITSLSPSTTYDVYVRADCGMDDTDVSIWVGPLTLSTACVAVTSYPSCETFPGPDIPLCWTTQGPADWEVGTADWGALNAGDHTPGGGTEYIFADGSDVNGGESIELYTPFYDISSLNAPFLSYWVYSNNEDTPGDNNTLTVELWDGSNWILVETIQGDFPDWTEYIADVNQLASIIGNLIQFRFTFTSTANNDYENDILLDDICMKERPENDLAVTAIIAPTSACGMGTEQITIEVSNLGFQSQGGFFTSYSVNGVVQPVSPDGFFSSNLISGQSETYTFATPYDFSAPGFYTIQAWTELPIDSDNSNDTTTIVIENLPSVTSLPYIEDFESGTGIFMVGNASASATTVWELGAPTGVSINSANSGTNAFVTNLSGFYEDNTLTYLTSSCLDFSSLGIDPILEFAYITDSEGGWDGLWVEISLDAGSTWTKLGTGADPNWYNNAGDETFDGNSGGWMTASHALDGAAGINGVLLRFVFDSDGSVSDFEGAGIDDVSIMDACAQGFNLMTDSVNESQENNTADGEASVTPTTGNSPYIYTWSNGATTSTITDLNAGTYTVTVMDAIGCEDIAVIIVDATCVASIIGDTNYVPETQNTVTGDGSATVTADSPNAPYDYQWSNGAEDLASNSTTSMISGLNADVYTVTVTDATGCVEVSTIVVTSICPVNLGATYETSNESVEGAADGEITVFPSTGAAPYSYEWSSGGMTAVESGLSADVYTVTITDANGCAEILTISINAICPSSLGLSLSSTDETEEGMEDGTAAATTSAGSVPISFEWSNGETGSAIINLAPGTYTVTVTDANGCEEVGSTTVNVGPPPPVGVENISSINSLTLSPNPTRDIAYLDVMFNKSVNFELTLVNMVGQTLHQSFYSNSLEERVKINMSELPSGVYFIRLNIEGSIHTERIMKAN